MVLSGGRSLGARIAFRRNDSFEDLKETIITVNITNRGTIKNNNWLEVFFMRVQEIPVDNGDINFPFQIEHFI